MTEIRVAESAGFCFGVERAVDAVVSLLEKNQTVCTLGPIIHNPQMVGKLTCRGVRIVESPEEAPKDATLVIRSHGVGQDVMARIRQQPLHVFDATCPFVSKIHCIVEEHSRRGAVTLIAGDACHPEIVGIRGHCCGQSYTFSSPEELLSLADNTVFPVDASFIMVSQTTFNHKIWDTCVKIAKNLYTNLTVFDTICNATAKRQMEAVDLARISDRMVIVGGRHSSNTAKLRDVCSAICPTFLIETADELSREMLEGARMIGVTAGASTPADIIKEVLSTMSEIVNNNEVPETVPAVESETETVVEAVPVKTAETVAQETPEAVQEESAPAKSFDEMSFEEALEASLQNLTTDEKVRGVVVGIAPNEVQVEVVGRKQAGYIPIDELTGDPNANPEDIVKIGDELELLIMRTNDQEGTVMLSKKRIDSIKGWEKVVEAETSGAILEGTVTDVIKGGILANTNGVRIFIPASQASAVRMEDLSPLLRQKVRFKIIEVNQGRRRAVGSIRMVAKEERKEKEAAFWAQAEVGQTYTGVVKSLTSYGAFVDIGGVDGMIHISELSWSRIKHPSEVVNVGDTVEVYIRDLDTEKHKISLGYRKAEDNPWEIFKAQYPIGSVVTGKIVGMTAFGAFAQIIPGVDGLIHISQIANRRIDKPQDELKIGQEVTVKIINVDYDSKRISLSIRALLEDTDETVQPDDAAEDSAANVDTVSEQATEEQ